jgi:riboflavin biosynthesis pyrimidine reductase
VPIAVVSRRASLAPGDRLAVASTLLVTCAAADPDRRAALADTGVDVLVCGDDDVDLPLALEKIGAKFRVRTLMLEGGGKINGSMLRAGLIDEVSVLVAPVADGRIGTPALFDVEGEEVTPARLTFENVEKRADGVLWVRYAVEAAQR